MIVFFQCMMVYLLTGLGNQAAPHSYRGGFPGSIRPDQTEYLTLVGFPIEG
jgi:hypothetical protein